MEIITLFLHSFNENSLIDPLSVSLTDIGKLAKTGISIMTLTPVKVTATRAVGLPSLLAPLRPLVIV